MNTRNVFIILIAAAILLLYPVPVFSGQRPSETVKSKYWLPYPGGISRHVNQGFHGRWTHHDGNQNEYALDFGGVVGDIVCAARDGTVVRASDSDTTDDDNVIMIQHEDGENSVYAHNKLGSLKVSEGDEVFAGQEICQIGKLLHLHFAVWKGWRGIPMGFKDVNEPNGEPKEFRVYKSKNFLDKRKAGIIDPEELAKYSIGKLLKTARKYMQKKKYRRARRYFDRAQQHPGADDKTKKEVEEAYAKIEGEAGKIFEKAQKLLADGKARDAKKLLFRMMRYYKGTAIFDKARKLLRSIKVERIEKKIIIQSPEKLLGLVDELIKEERFNSVFNLLNSLGKLKNEVGEKAREIREKLMKSKEFMKKRADVKAQEEIRLIFERVENLIRYDNYDEAINHLKRIIRDYPDSAAAEKAKKKIDEIEEMR